MSQPLHFFRVTKIFRDILSSQACDFKFIKISKLIRTALVYVCRYAWLCAPTPTPTICPLYKTRAHLGFCPPHSGVCLHILSFYFNLPFILSYKNIPFVVVLISFFFGFFFSHFGLNCCDMLLWFLSEKLRHGAINSNKYRKSGVQLNNRTNQPSTVPVSNNTSNSNSNRSALRKAMFAIVKSGAENMATLSPAPPSARYLTPSVNRETSKGSPILGFQKE